MSMASWSVKNRVAVNIFTLVVVFAGYYAAFTQLQRDLLALRRRRPPADSAAGFPSAA